MKKTRAISTLIKNVKPDKYFFISDGRAIKNVRELAYALDDMSDETFRNHVNKDKNDFAAWISDVIGDVELAESLGGEKDKKMLQKKICFHLIRKIR